MAGTRYTAGSPELSAYISGANEFTPGKDIPLTIVIQNTGLNEYKFINSVIVDRDDLPNTAKFLTVSLNPGDIPIVIKSDSQMVGDLKGGNNANAVFSIKVKSDAVAGTYQLPIALNYTYLYAADQFGADTIQYQYKTVTENLTTPINIKSDVSIDVLEATPEHLNAGAEGYIRLKIKNTGSEFGTKSIVKITQNGNSPIVPTDSSVYIGDFPPGSIAECQYKVAVSTIAERQAYPIDVAVVYQNKEGDFVTSRTDTIGIPVGGKTDFAIVSTPPELNPGNKKTITVEFKNTGETTVYSAQARISAVDPFTCNDDVAYLGNLKAGESAKASYIISVDRSATIKEYGLDSEIRYRDALDNTHISDTMKVAINVSNPAGIMTILLNPIYLSVLVAIIIGIAYGIYHYRMKKQ